MVAATQPVVRPVDGAETIINCYTLFDRVFPDLGMLDYTEGIYHGNRRTPYDVAQQNQINYVLDEVECGPGVRILEIGCGNGTLLDEVSRRRAVGVGLTITPAQVERCRARGLDVRLVNYRHLDETYRGQFDAVVLNGPIEHFVQAEQAAAGQDDAIYRELFQISHQALDPASPIRKLINTTIHFVRPPDPADLCKSPWTFRWGSDPFHWSLLHRSFGGWYPVAGQFARCAAGYFEHQKTVDGTQDYHWTSEDWLGRVQQALLRMKKVPRIVKHSAPLLFRFPRQFLTMWFTMMVSQSWNWQFRGANPPTRLLRQTWTALNPPRESCPRAKNHAPPLAISPAPPSPAPNSLASFAWALAPRD